MCVECFVQCGSCKYVLSHSLAPQSPSKQCLSLFRLVLLDFCCWIVFGMCVYVWVCGLYLSHTHPHARWDFTKAAGRCDYKLASVLISFWAVNWGTFILFRYGAEHEVFLLFTLVESWLLTTSEADSKNIEVKWCMHMCLCFHGWRILICLLSLTNETVFLLSWYLTCCRKFERCLFAVLFFHIYRHVCCWCLCAPCLCFFAFYSPCGFQVLTGGHTCTISLRKVRFVLWWLLYKSRGTQRAIEGCSLFIVSLVGRWTLHRCWLSDPFG